MNNLALSVRNLEKNFGALQAVKNLNLSITAGEFFGLLGPNGAGKTTSINMMSSLVRPSKGFASVFGLDVVKNPVKVREKIGLVFQDSALDRQLTVWENLRFAGLLHNLPFNEVSKKADYLLRLFNLFDKKNSPVAVLSGGQRRVLDIARGVMHEPNLLFLDEPTIGLDLPTRRNIWRFINKLRAEFGMTVLLTTHYLEEAENCDRVSFLKKGSIVLTGNPKNLVNDLACEIVEIETQKVDQVLEFVKQIFGIALVEYETLFFKIEKNSLINVPEAIGEIKKKFGLELKRVIVRQPNLNDVFLWVNFK